MAYEPERRMPEEHPNAAYAAALAALRAARVLHVVGGGPRKTSICSYVRRMWKRPRRADGRGVYHDGHRRRLDLDGVPMRVFRPEDLLLRKIYLIRHRRAGLA